VIHGRVTIIKIIEELHPNAELIVIKQY